MRLGRKMGPAAPLHCRRDDGWIVPGTAVWNPSLPGSVHNATVTSRVVAAEYSMMILVLMKQEGFDTVYFMDSPVDNDTGSRDGLVGCFSADFRFRLMADISERTGVLYRIK
jgi:hypothetical protein